MKKIVLLLVVGLSLGISTYAQDVEPATNEAPKQKFTRATFNATKLINMQTVEMVSKGNLQFLISHHFSNIWNKGEGRQNLGQLFGLNSGVARTYLSFDYSPHSWVNLGLAAAGSSKYEGWAKFKILRQQTGLKNVPISLGWYSMASIYTSKKEPDEFVGNRWSYMHQLLIARKFSDKFSLQLMPTVLHFNVVPYGANNSNQVYSMGIGGKYKATSKLNITFEYARQLNMYENIISKNGTILNYEPNLYSAGIEINTGGHLFQFYVGNTTESSNIDHLARNSSKNLALGFTINRSLSLKK